MRFALLALAMVIPCGLGLAQQPPEAKLPPGHPPIDGLTTITHHGTVIETIEVAPYVYLKVKGDGGEQWLAAPAVKLVKGDKVAWPDGMAMTNYHSKSLNRDFAEVTFVQSVTGVK